MLNPLLHNEKELLIQIANGNASAFQQVFTGYYDKLFSTALTYTKVQQHAEDIVQQVFLKLWEKKEKLTTIDSLDNYLFIIVRNEAMNFFRTEGRSQRYIQYVQQLFHEEAHTPLDQLLLKQKRELIEKAIAALPPQQQQAWKLSRTMGLPQEEIATQMGIALSTVKGHIGKALQAIRISLQTQIDLLIIFSLIFF